MANGGPNMKQFVVSASCN